MSKIDFQPEFWNAVMLSFLMMYNTSQEYLWSDLPIWKEKFHLINCTKMTCESVIHYIWHFPKVPKSEIHIFPRKKYVEKRKQKIPTEVAKMKKKKMVDEMIIGVTKEALLRRVEPTAQVVLLQ